MKFVERAVIALLCCAMLFAVHQIVGTTFAAHGWEGMSPSDWAAWVQAVGATVGIGIAIYIPAKQKRDTAAAEDERRMDSARRVCMAFNDELSTLRENLSGTNVTELLALPRGGIFNRRIPAPHSRFPIYTAFIGRITEIDDPEIRHGIIGVYEAANALVEAAILNNQLLLDHREATGRVDTAPSEYNHQAVLIIEAALENMCAQMQSVAMISLQKLDIILLKLAPRV